MEFKVGDKVKVKEELTSKLQANLYTKMASTMRHKGVIVDDPTCPKSYSRVMFSNGEWYYVQQADLESTLIKNQQLLFSFMEK